MSNHSKESSRQCGAVGASRMLRETHPSRQHCLPGPPVAAELAGNARCAQDILVMRFREEEAAGRLGAAVGDTPVAGIAQHALLAWYFQRQAERYAASRTHAGMGASVHAVNASVSL